MSKCLVKKLLPELLPVARDEINVETVRNVKSISCFREAGSVIACQWIGTLQICSVDDANPFFFLQMLLRDPIRLIVLCTVQS